MARWPAIPTPRWTCDSAAEWLTPRLLFDAGGGWVLRASAQIPLSDSGLNGNQDEKIVVNLGVTRLFKP